MAIPTEQHSFARSGLAGVTRGKRPKGRRPESPGYAWILPALAVSVGLLYFCFGYTGFISTLDWDGSSPEQVSVGAENYLTMLQDPIFWGALWHTAVFFAVTFSCQTILGVVFAAMLHSRVRLGVVYKVVIFVPVVIAPAIMAPVFRQIFAADGQFNWILNHLGLGALAQPWLAQGSTALPVIMVITIWEWTGLTFVLYYAAMGQIDTSTIEAARIDGAGNIRVLVSVIFPGIRGTFIALLMLTIISSLKTFDVPWLVTVGGPNYATAFLGTEIYRVSIQLAHVGYGAAISITLMVMAIVMAVILGLRNRRSEA